jgi:hypothetical protein
MAALLASKSAESFWPNFVFYWLTQTLPLGGMLLLGARVALVSGSATALLCFLLLCSALIEQSGGWLFYVFGVFGATIVALIASDSCRFPWSTSAVAYSVGFGAIAAGVILPLVVLVFTVYRW